MKFDLPDPFAPTRRLMSRSGKRSTLLMLLKPLIVIQSSAANVSPSEQWARSRLAASLPHAA